MRNSSEPLLDFAVCEEIRNEPNVTGLRMIQKGEVVSVQIRPVPGKPNTRLVEEISVHLAKSFPRFAEVFIEAVDRPSVSGEEKGDSGPVALEFRYDNPSDLRTFETGFRMKRLGQLENLGKTA